MKTSLKTKLNDLIKSRNGGIVTINEIEYLCKENQYKMSNAERRLRASESPNIVRVMKHGAIIGYRWKLAVQSDPSTYTAKQFLKEFPSKKPEVVNTLF